MEDGVDLRGKRELEEREERRLRRVERVSGQFSASLPTRHTQTISAKASRAPESIPKRPKVQPRRISVETH
jgi:hypothetical protein